MMKTMKEVAEEYEIWPVVSGGGVGRETCPRAGAGGCSLLACADLRACPHTREQGSRAVGRRGPRVFTHEAQSMGVSSKKRGTRRCV